MYEKEKPRMVKCPECSLELPENAQRAQIEHMESEHPEVIARRLEKIGMSGLQRVLR